MYEEGGLKMNPKFRKYPTDLVEMPK